MIGVLGRVFKRERERSEEVRKYVRIGKALSLKTKELGWLYWERPQRQMVVFGASGSGKSEFLTRLMYEDIVNGFQSFNIDPKGSKSWLEAFFKACDRIGKLYDKDGGPVVLALNYPEVSFRFNPLYGLDPHQIASVVASGLPDSKEPFWWNISYEITLAIALALKAKGYKQICFGDIYEYLNVNKIQELQNKIARVYARNPTPEVSQAMVILEKIGSYDPQYFPRVNSTLRTYLTRLITGKTGYILNVKTDRDLLRERIKAGNLRFFAFLNAEKEGQTAYDVARLLFAWLLAVVGEYSRDFAVIEPQLRVNVDEATEVGFWEINKAIRLVRERNVAIKLFTQSPSGFKSAFKQGGDNIVQDIINNCDCRIAFSINEPTDQEYFAEMSGRIQKPRTIVHKHSLDLTYSEGTLLDPQDFSQLPAGWGYCFMDGEVYMFYSPLVEDKRRVKIIWGKEKEGKGDVEVDLGKIYELVVEMVKIIQHYTSVVLKEEIKDQSLREFYQKYKDWWTYYEEEFEKVVRWMDGVRGMASVVKGKNPLKNIGLVDHSVRVAENLIKQIQETQEPKDQREREILVLAGLVHDLGKAVADTVGYKMSDHVKELEELLITLGLPEEVISVAVRHHDKTEDTMVQALQKADWEAREEETELVEGEIEDRLRNMDGGKLWGMLLDMANRDREFRVWTYKGKLYVEVGYLLNWLANEIEIRPTKESVRRVFEMDLEKVRVFVKGAMLFEKEFFTTEYNVHEHDLESRKIGNNFFKGFRVEHVDGGTN